MCPHWCRDSVIAGTRTGCSPVLKKAFKKAPPAHIQAEIPGVKKEDINVTINGNQVAISAEVKREREDKQGEKVLRSGRYYGKVYRAFSLAQDVDEGSAQAKYNEGVLELRLPKKAAVTAKKLSIQ